MNKLVWIAPARSGSHAIMEAYAAMAKCPVRLEPSVRLYNPKLRGYSYSSADGYYLRESAVKYVNWTGQPAAYWMGFEDLYESPEMGDADRIYVYRDLRPMAASRRKMMDTFQTQADLLNPEWLYGFYHTLVMRVLNGANAILYDKWYASQIYRDKLINDLPFGIPMEYNENTLGKLCNPRPEASSFDPPDTDPRTMRVLFRDEQCPVSLPGDLLELNEQVLKFFDFDREEYR